MRTTEETQIKHMKYVAAVICNTMEDEEVPPTIALGAMVMIMQAMAKKDPKLATALATLLEGVAEGIADEIEEEV